MGRWVWSQHTARGHAPRKCRFGGTLKNGVRENQRIREAFCEAEKFAAAGLWLLRPVEKEKRDGSVLQLVLNCPEEAPQSAHPNARNLAGVVYPILWGCENFPVVTTQHALQWKARPVIHSRFVGLCF